MFRIGEMVVNADNFLFVDLFRLFFCEKVNCFIALYLFFVYNMSIYTVLGR